MSNFLKHALIKVKYRMDFVQILYNCAGINIFFKAVFITLIKNSNLSGPSSSIFYVLLFTLCCEFLSHSEKCNAVI